MLDKWLDNLIARHFRVLMALVLVSGIALLLLSRQFQPDTLWRELIRDLGIATVVSFIVTVVIETYSARRREADIRSGVLDAILGKIIPMRVWDEIRSNIIAPGIVCEGWHLEASVSKRPVVLSPAVVLSPGQPPEESLVATGTLTYRLHNQLNREQTVPISHELQCQARGTDQSGALPAFLRWTCTPSSGESVEYDGAALRQKKLWRADMLKIPTPIAPSPGAVQIGLKRREIIPVPGVYPWYMNWVTENPTITIKTDATDLFFRVIARHPNSKLLRQIIPGEAWTFDGVLLPGQALEIVCTDAMHGPPLESEINDGMGKTGVNIMSTLRGMWDRISRAFR